MNVPRWIPKDVFISYARSERVRAVRIAESLHAFGLTAWFDAALEPGRSFDEEIAREVGAARAVMVCWSKESVSSRWVRSEATIGAKRHVLVPVFLETCDLLPPFNLDHTEDLSGWRGEVDHEGWINILRRLGALTGRKEALADWAVACSVDGIKSYRTFLKAHPSDILTKAAKERIWKLELDATRSRLTSELGITVEEHAEAMIELQSRTDQAEMRAEAAEAARRRSEVSVREARERAETLLAERNLADERRQQAEVTAAEAETRALEAEARALVAAEARAVAEQRVTQADSEAKRLKALEALRVENPPRLDKVKSDIGGSQPQDGLMRPCSSCGKMINVAATRCGYCWSKLDDGKGRLRS